MTKAEGPYVVASCSQSCRTLQRQACCRGMPGLSLAHHEQSDGLPSEFLKDVGALQIE